MTCWGTAAAGSPQGVTIATLVTGAGGAGCGITTEGYLRCWVREVTAPPERLKDAQFVHASITTGLGCGVMEKGAVECWRTGDAPLGFTPPKGRFVSVSVGAWQVCGITSNGGLRCVNVPEKVP